VLVVNLQPKQKNRICNGDLFGAVFIERF